MKIRTSLAALGTVAAIALVAACGTGTTDGAADTSTRSSTSASANADSGATGQSPGDSGPGGGAVDVSSVSTEEQLVALIQDAYGDAGLGLQRGHQPVESTLISVLGISHDEMHVRMEEQGQNLAAMATDLGIDPQTLIDALVDSWSPAIDTLLDNGTITQDEATAYRKALEDAFTFRVTWNGSDATPTFSGLDA